MPQKIPLDTWHRSHGAKMVEFGGFEMPVSYRGVLAEHETVRERCGLFDISHMGEFIVEGENAEAFLQKLTTNDLSRLDDGQAQYSLLLYPEAGVVDDIIVYRLSAKRFMLCVNASNIQKDFNWLQSHLEPGVVLQDQSAATGLIALQGPHSFALLEKLDFDLKRLKRFEFCETQLASCPLWISRTGYTGEEGCEIFLPNAYLEKIWKALLEAGAKEGLEPIGLGARDTLRLEMGYPLYGHEISESINPFEAGLAWVVKMNKPDFIGKAALQKIKQEGIKRRLIGLVMEDQGIPRQAQNLISEGRPVGEVLSGTFSPTLKIGIATALVESKIVEGKTEISVDIRGKIKKAKITSLPFVKK